MSLRASFALTIAFMLLSAVAQAAGISYSKDIQPIFTDKCVACHACYDSPCQLNLSAAEGAQRGANKLPVYDGTRTKAQETTRLFLDAHGADAWRRKDFWSVLDARGGQAALMQRMLDLGQAHPLVPNAKIPEGLDLSINRSNQCPTPDSIDEFVQKNPRSGMPFAVTGLSAQQYATLKRWLAEGAPVDEQAWQPGAGEARQIAEWERFLNQPGARESLVSRWLYEHLFLAHLYFEEQGAPGHFFQLVRSRTPSGQPIDPIATRRPNDDPGAAFYYRLWPIQGVIVHKTHITYPLSPAKLAHTRELFFADAWAADKVPGYGLQHRANPFETFAAIPARARYQFMLDNAEYFVRTFIRGPVCRGQIATDVIRDNFWAIFQDPAHDLYVTDPAYRAKATPLLGLPGQIDDMGQMLQQWTSYRDKRNEYEALRLDAYEEAAAPTWADIWRGNDNALLSIFRQYDSASVRKGLIGGVPQTLWWMDYPLLERTYYQLVVNFDVYGNVSHQAQTRLYFDLIRNGAEQNFLRLMPVAARKHLLDDWYQNSGRLKMWLDYQNLDNDAPTGLDLPEKGAKNAFAVQLLSRYASLDARPDPINLCQDGGCYRRSVPRPLQDAEQAFSRLVSRPAAGLKVIEQFPEATILRVELPGGKREIYTALRNRAHSNVAFMLGESLRYQPGLDTLTIYPGVLSSYPNFMFDLKAEEAGDFVSALERVQSQEDFDKVVERWGIRRSNPQFWRYFHDLDAYLRETEPVEAGILDMNRYENL
ncbi:Fatty acid cis/trans isomerase (CTI) [Pseudomonas citronellolis]|uniref:Fatty acid cis/trans isomerase (CTI) n=1 Tax=Pseudomonas citronellolis TaxID=53408 RepID=A0AAQ1QZ19_9PSED|nr:fatty acid cis/trans isomerase [Pseudomonas citronellolis]TGC32501.1 peptidylprolyl isomerase [Pseudomonas citronellolis]SFD54445.1 Fatty acid cis/trans isomerase (CTI) [Pseudomonas citronellolis]